VKVVQEEKWKLEDRIMKKFFIGVLILGFGAWLSAQDRPLNVYVSEAKALQEEGKLKEAVALLKESVLVYPNESNVYLTLGLMYGQLGQKSGETGDFMTAMTAVNEGFSAFEKAIELDPKNVDAYFYFGIYGVNVPSFFGRLDSGVEHLEKALAILKDQSEEKSGEKLASLYRFLGQGYEMQGRLEEARTAWQEAVQLSPAGEIGEAARAGLKSLDLAKGSDETKKTKSKEESPKVLALKKKMKESPEDFTLLVELGKAYFEEQAWGEATATFKRAVQLKPSDAEVQFLLAKAILVDASQGYDERIYENTDFRTGLAFESAKQMEEAYKLDPANSEVKLYYAITCIEMPFFVGRSDQGLALLEEMVKDENTPVDIRTEALYRLGQGYRKKGNAVWMKLIKDHPKAGQIQSVYDEFGLREHGKDAALAAGEKVAITFHLGFLDELAPQTGLWIEDANGAFVKTLYVSGFSGYAKEKQVNLPDWSKSSKFETDGTTGASIDWGKYTYMWDLTDHQGKRVQNGTYKVQLEVSWWPSMKYGRASAEIRVGSSPDEIVVERAPFVPKMHVKYVR